MHAGGHVLERRLAPGETLRVDTGCVVGFEASVDYDIQMAKGIKTMLFGGEGLFLALLTGPGRVWIQTTPFSRLADRIIDSAPSHGGSAKGEGSLLGGIGRIIDGK